MKKIQLIIVAGLCAVVLFAVGCDKDKYSHPNPNPPHPPLAIDWEGYNNAYDVYWTYTTKCSMAAREDHKKTIKVIGWMVQQLGGG